MPPGRATRLLGVFLAATMALPVGSCTKLGDDRVGGPALAPLRIRRLLQRQYVNSVRDLLGARAARQAAPPVDLASQGFLSIGAAELAPSDGAIAQYETSARAVAEFATTEGLDDLARWIPCSSPAPSDSACMREFVETFGRAAWRRPLTSEEVDRHLAIATEAATVYSSFMRGAEYAIQGLLQSPHFIYQIEVGEEDPENPWRLRLTGYELASRMSFFLLDTTPSLDLLDAAEAGDLDTQEGIRDVATELLSGPAAQAALESFYDERFRLGALTAINKDPEMFPEYTSALAESMRQEALRLLSYIVWEQDADYRELLTARYTFVDGALAALYGVAPPANPQSFEKRDLPDAHQRAGVLGQAAFLAAQAHPADTSPTRRGRFIAERFLCLQIPPPPPNVVPELPPDPPGTPQTMRQKLTKHMEDPACASCHTLMDPIGLALESFDGIGKFRSTDRGLPLDLAGEIPELGSFTGAVEMADLIVNSPELHDCWIRNLYRHATAHIEVLGESFTLANLNVAFETSGFRVKSLLLELVASDGFRYAGPQPEGR